MRIYFRNYRAREEVCQGPGGFGEWPLAFRGAGNARHNGWISGLARFGE